MGGGGGVGGLNPRRRFLFACQYMEIPADLDPKPPLEEFLPRTPLEKLSTVDTYLILYGYNDNF